MNPGKIAYAAYCAAVCGTTFDGKPLPTFEELGDRQRTGWEAAAITCGLPGKEGDIMRAENGIEGRVSSVVRGRNGRNGYWLECIDSTGRPYDYWVEASDALYLNGEHIDTK